MHLSRYAAVFLVPWIQAGSARLLGVPTMPFTISSPATQYHLTQIAEIIVDSRYRDSVDTDGQTLIPPTLQGFATTFGADLASSLGLHIPVHLGTKATKNSIFLTLVSESRKSLFKDAAGRPSSEGYTLDVTKEGVTLTGASPLGVWWGTRTILQQAVLGNLSIPVGSGTDAPGWGIRGVMLDVGRHYYPPSFLIEMCSYLSFFKQNTFHLHLSDNLANNVNIYTRERSLELYSAFRPNSDDPAVAGLSRRANESYYRNDLDEIQQRCANRGVTIIPELEAPGHALVITQWKPELGLSSDLSLLNISYPETIPTMQLIWSTFLPWFHSKTVHIGADEYSSEFIADYTTFVNDMNSFIRDSSSKDIRIWGTFPPSVLPNVTNVNQNVSIQHWEYFEANPYFDFIQRGYNVLNSDDGFYIVGKFSSYPQFLNSTRIFFGNPAGGAYAPNIFDTSNATNNPARDNPAVLGHIAAQWNDYGPNATSVLEAYYSWRDFLAALGDKQWGGDINLEEYESIFEPLLAAAPAQNLDRRVPSKSNVILNYTFSGTNHGSTVKDTSGNGYDGTLHGCTYADHILRLSGGCYLETPLGSKGRDYTLSFSVNPSSARPGILFDGPDSTLLSGNGSITNVTLLTGGNPYILNYSLPINTWTDVSLIGRGNATFLTVQGSGGVTNTMEFITKLGINGEGFAWGPMGIEAPLARIGEGFDGLMQDIVLLGSA